MRTYRRRRGRMLLGSLLSTVMVLAGLGIISYSMFGNPLSAYAPHGAPDNTALRLTVPAMARVNDVPVYNGPTSDEEDLNRGALHISSTGYPWQSGSNTYIAGHRLGYAGTGSFLLFYDLNKLHNGDEIILTDSNGTRYTYKVFRKVVVSPGNLSIMQPVPGKTVVSLQSCTLPTYTHRLVVQGELVSVS
jgi:sortase A